MSEELEEKAFIADMQGIYAQHAQMWSIYNDTVRLLVTVSALPFIAAGIVLQVTKELDITHLPPVVFSTLLLTPFVAFVVVAVIIHHRLVINFYARALNKYRSIYANKAAAAGHPMDLRPMLTNPEYPPNYEPLGPMG